MDDMNLKVVVKSVDISSISKVDISDNVALYSVETNIRWPVCNTILIGGDRVQISIFDSADTEIKERTMVDFHLPKVFEPIKDSVELICKVAVHKNSLDVFLVVRDEEEVSEIVWTKGDRENSHG